MQLELHINHILKIWYLQYNYIGSTSAVVKVGLASFLGIQDKYLYSDEINVYYTKLDYFS